MNSIKQKAKEKRDSIVKNLPLIRADNRAPIFAAIVFFVAFWASYFFGWQGFVTVLLVALALSWFFKI